MAVEIKELVIKANVEEQPSRPAEATIDRAQLQQMEQNILNKCRKLMRDTIEEHKRR